jgi:hypothetical protein
LVTKFTTPAGSPASCSASMIRPWVAGHHGVAAGERGGDRAHAQDHRRVPGRDAEHHASGLAHRHRHRAGHVRGEDAALDTGGQRGRLQQHAGRQVDVEAGPDRRSAGLRSHRCGEGLGARLERLRGLHQQCAALAGAGGGPGGEGRGGGLDRGHRVGGGGGRGARGDAVVERVAAFEAGAVRGAAVLAADQQVDLVHRWFPLREGDRARLARAHGRRWGIRC